MICPSWLTEVFPAKVDKFWTDAGNGLDAVSDNVFIMQKTGYSPVAVFTLPENCWTDHCFIPRRRRNSLFKKYPVSVKVFMSIFFISAIKSLIWEEKVVWHMT